MALFQVERYMGQDNQSAEPQDDLLQKLHEKAKAREKHKKKGQQPIVTTKSPSDKKAKVKSKKQHHKPPTSKMNVKINSEINEQSPAESEVGGIDEQLPENETKTKAKKHKRKHGDIVTDDTQILVEKKKKKKKHKRSKDVEDGEPISDWTSKDSDRTNGDTEMQVQNSQKSKKKKKKEKEIQQSDDYKLHQSSVKSEKKRKSKVEHDDGEEQKGLTFENNEDGGIQEMEEDGAIESSDENDMDVENEISFGDQDDSKEDEDGITGEEDGSSTDEDSEKDDDFGFTILGGVEEKSKKKVMRVLPEWLSHPTIVEHDLTHNQVAVDDYPLINTKIADALKQNNIQSLFPVQRHVIPIILDSVKFGLHAGNAGYRPRDICVSAPTGSGKTLAFAVPVVQALHDRVVPRIRALAVLPTRDLANQVYRVFAMLCNAVSLRAVLLGGQKSFDKEQELLRKYSPSDDIQVDILVATPGRLVDHINNTKGFTLQYLRFLIIDEADRMMEEISKDWISQVEKSAYPGKPGLLGVSSIVQARPKPGPVTVASYAQMHQPMQKLLFSATLSQNPEKLTHLNLFQPRLITTLVAQGQQRRSKGQAEVTGEGEETGEFVGKFTTPVGLTEFYIECSKADKPLVVLHLTRHLHCKQVLCFTNTVEATHRLYLLMKIVGGVNVAEFSSNIKAAERQQILKKFKAGKIDLLICSDAMARGMDIDNVRFVISYGLPPYLKTYIHRVGRTARAGKPGIAFSLLQKSEVPMFKSMLKNAGKTEIERHIVREGDLQPLMMDYEDALDQLPDILKKEKSWTTR